MRGLSTLVVEKGNGRDLTPKLAHEKKKSHTGHARPFPLICRRKRREGGNDTGASPQNHYRREREKGGGISS